MLKLRLFEMLKREGISKRKFAIKLGKRPQHVLRYFRPDYDPKLSTLEEWSKVLKCKVKDLFDD